MAANIVWSTLFLGNIADMDTDEGTTSIEDSSEILATFGSTGDPLYKNIVDVTTNSSDDNTMTSNNTATSDTLSYDLGGGTVVSTIDSLPLMAGTVTFNDGSTLSLTDLSVFQDTNGNLFLAIRDNQPALAAQGIRSVEFTSVTGSAYSGLTQLTRDDLEFVCYAPGTMIETPDGPRPVESLQLGDLIQTLDHGPQVIRWTHSSEHPLKDTEADGKPVQIKAGALGRNLPAHDLIVSPQHRILVGGAGQLQRVFAIEAFAPAKSLTAVPGIRHMKGKTQITWIHFACDQHEVVTANGCLSESLLLGPMVVNGLSSAERRALSNIFGPAPTPDAALNGPSARKCLTAGAVKCQIAKHLKDKGRLLAMEIQKWDRDQAMEKYEAEQLREVASLSQLREKALRVA